MVRKLCGEGVTEEWCRCGEGMIRELCGERVW